MTRKLEKGQCGATDAQYPGEFLCRYPTGHGPNPTNSKVTPTGHEHGDPTQGAYWTAPLEPSAARAKAPNDPMLLHQMDQTARLSGLSSATCHELLQHGWTYTERLRKPRGWTAPAAQTEWSD